MARLTLRQAAERIVSLLAADASGLQMRGSRGATIALACRLLEAGRPHAALTRLAADLPDGRLATLARIEICRIHKRDR